jgi:hypothetical protein
MAHQMRLTSPQFKDFVNCPLQPDQYLELLIQGKHILRRSLHIDKTTKKEVDAHCTTCNRKFTGLQQIIEKAFEEHQCEKASTRI